MISNIDFVLKFTNCFFFYFVIERIGCQVKQETNLTILRSYYVPVTFFKRYIGQYYFKTKSVRIC
jgi:hypothetical protein